MCGICGQFNIDRNKSVDETIISRMVSSLSHRGPDDSGIFIEKNFGIGMRRLSIIDLELAKQPIFNENSNMVIVYNGELYNYKELREELIKRGHQFKTKGDTETILHLYEEFGEKCLDKMDGMYAFSIWNRETKELFIGRDRMGIKPVYYILKNGVFLFASELKSIVINPNFRRDINHKSLSNFFSYSYIPGPETIYKDVYELEPGHFLRISADGMLKNTEYWDIPIPVIQKKEKEQYYFEKFDFLVKNAVKKCLVSDVPVALMLSGGIDSNGLLAIMKEYYNAEINTFTIGFEEKSYDESGYARDIAKYFGTTHNEKIYKPGDIIDTFKSLVRYSDTLLACTASIPRFMASSLAVKYNKVAIDGSGGDELFLGYSTYRADIIARYYRRLVPGIIRKFIKNGIIYLPASHKLYGIDYLVKRFTEGAEFEREKSHYWWRTIFTDDEKNGLFIDPDLSRNKSEYEYIKHFERKKEFSFLDSASYADMKVFLTMILTMADNMSMCNSVELRPPFMDHNIVEFAFKVPLSIRFKNLQIKYFLRKYFRNLLPEEVIKRKKIGLNVPLAVWFNKELKDFVYDVLSPDNIKNTGLLRYDMVLKTIEDHNMKKFNNSYKIWSLLIFVEWYRQYILNKGDKNG